VETKEQLDLLRELDCQCVQGFLMSRPLIPELAEKWIVSSASKWPEPLKQIAESQDASVIKSLASQYSM
jgi:hypothetical protein